VAQLNVLFVSATCVLAGGIRTLEEIPPEGVEARASGLHKAYGPFEQVIVGRLGDCLVLLAGKRQGKSTGFDVLAMQTEDSRWEIFREGGIWDSFAVLPAASTPS
jgi:hypothetical protein